MTRHKAFDEPGNKLNRTGSITGEGGKPDNGILVESGSESEFNIRAVPQAGSEEEDGPPGGKRMKRKRKRDESLPESPEHEDKKLRFKTNYEGFNIHGWMLCLLVTRKSDKGKARVEATEPKRQILMEEWISTQAQGDLDEE